MKIPNFKKSESMGRSAARFAGSKRWLAAIVFLVLVLALTACGGKDKPKDPQPDEPPAPVETPKPPAARTVEIEGVTYEIVPVSGVPEPTELDYEAEKAELVKHSGGGGMYEEYVSNVRILSSKYSEKIPHWMEVETENVNKEKRIFYVYEPFHQVCIEPNIDKVVGLVWNFQSNSEDPADEDFYPFVYDIFYPEQDSFDTGMPSSYKLYNDGDWQTLSGVVKQTDIGEGIYSRMYLLGEDGKMYELYFIDIFVDEYMTEPGNEVKLEWLPTMIILETDEALDSVAGVYSVMLMTDIELAGASAGLQPPPYEYERYAPSVIMPDERTLPAATVEEMNTDTESIFVSLVMADEQRLVSLEESFDGYPFEALEFKGLLNDRTSLSFVREGERFLGEDYDMPYFYIIWRNAELRDPATGEEGLYKYVIGIETYYGNTDEFLAEPTTTRKLWKSEKKVVEGSFEELAMGDYYYIIMKDNDGLIYSFFISYELEDVWTLETTEKGTPIKVTYYEMEMYVWENGARLLDRQAIDYELN